MMRPRQRCVATAVVMAVLAHFATPVPGRAEVVDEAPMASENGYAEEGAAAEEAGPAVRTFGSPDQRLHVVDYGVEWSMHAENLVTDVLLRLWQEAGGPQVISKTMLDRPYTISVHRLAPERILERLLDGYGYTLHYDEGGRLERVRVYSPVPAQSFKTPRLVESLARWHEVETAPAAADASR